ncbi:hypothetical protein [Lactococcus protaetiae]|uniref:Uncharacterized protein n=1 Tax=Lactococcus protaetiae TaxID=2592653 RepID=A0A514Z889_9LACT|nr:hypothetical protein [Lactococcus protaetiae]QDK70727.1 hypothetical protein FLP15_05625 [Lactococcus protaetiae]
MDELFTIYEYKRISRYLTLKGKELLPNRRYRILKMEKSEQIHIAVIFWERLVAVFNEEAKIYGPEDYNSPLGLIGGVSCQEVCRPQQWAALGGETLIGSHHDSEIGGKNGEDKGYEDY